MIYIFNARIVQLLMFGNSLCEERLHLWQGLCLRKYLLSLKISVFIVNSTSGHHSSYCSEETEFRFSYSVLSDRGHISGAISSEKKGEEGGA